jgi:hypothetical protein
VTKLRFVIVAVIAMAMLVVPGAAIARHHSGHKTKHAKRHHKRHGRVHHGATTNSQTSQSPSETQNSNGSVEVRNSSVVSFDSTTGKLTITVPGNQTLSGNVTNATEIECEAAGQQGDDEHGQDENGQGNDRRMFRHGSESSASSQGDEQDSNGDQQDENDNDADDQGAQSQQCSTADLTQGAQIAEAQLDSNGDFTKVELVK